MTALGRWATVAEQNRAKRTNVYLEFNGRKQILLDWARELGMNPASIRQRMASGWPVARALSTPPDHRNQAACASAQQNEVAPQKAARSRVKLVYVAGPYSASGERTVEDNVKAAREVARVVATAHPLLFPVVPHQLGAGVKDVGDYACWIAGTLELMRRCDVVVLVAGWEGSRGARAEVAAAQDLGIPVFRTDDHSGLQATLRDFVIEANA